ncbi:MAG: DUF1611 domain-containing protein [Saprospiraceae bacterium]|nr:DUF1611 domain-containing protein [Saprospiraceae bacterium]
MKSTAIVLTNGMLDTDMAKTCHGLLRGTERFDILAVIDPPYAGKDAGEVMDGRHCNVPVFASVSDYLQKAPAKPQYCIVGVALPGGQLPDSFRAELLSAMRQGVSLVNGLHTLLNEDSEFSQTAREFDVELIDIRRPRPAKELRFWNGEIFSVKAPRIAVLGTDCALGKRTTCRFLLEMCRRNGIAAEMIYTGQTGWMQGYRHGFIFDSTLNDFISGEVERAVVECDRESKPDLILIEGQSALRNPSGPCGAEFILSADAKYVVLQHAPGRLYYEGTEAFQYRIPPIETEIALIRAYGAEVLAVTINEEGMDDAGIERYRIEMEAKLGIPFVRPLQEGVERLLPVVKGFLGV